MSLKLILLCLEMPGVWRIKDGHAWLWRFGQLAAFFGAGARN